MIASKKRLQKKRGVNKKCKGEASGEASLSKEQPDPGNVFTYLLKLDFRLKLPQKKDFKTFFYYYLHLNLL